MENGGLTTRTRASSDRAPLATKSRRKPNGRRLGWSTKTLDREVGIDVVLTHECDHVAVELSLHDFDEVVMDNELVVVPVGSPEYAAELDEMRASPPHRCSDPEDLL